MEAVEVEVLVAAALAAAARVEEAMGAAAGAATGAVAGICSSRLTPALELQTCSGASRAGAVQACREASWARR